MFRNAPESHPAVALAALLGMLVAGSVTAAPPRVGTTERAVDVVTLESGDRVLGIVTNRTEREVVVAVRRAWLESEHPERLRVVERAERAERQEQHEARIERIDAWRKDHTAQPPLAEFLEKERTRIEKAFDPAPAASEFVRLSFPMGEVRRVYVQRPSRRQVALLALRERLDDVENRRADELARSLQRAGVQVPRGPIDLSDRLPQPPTDDPAAWAARVAVVEYEYVERLDFQGTGGLLVRTTGDDAGQPGLADVLKAFTKQAQPLDLSNLANLVDPPKGAAPTKRPDVQPKGNEFDSAIKEAEKRGIRGFRVTRVDPQLERQRVDVETRFVARIGERWTTVWRHVETLDASKPRPELEARIADDERVGELFKTIRALGVGGEAQLKTALRFGAATMEAQSAADDAFYDFVQATTKSLDTPWPSLELAR